MNNVVRFLFTVISILSTGLLIAGCTIRPKFTPTIESDKEFKVIYQEEAPAQTETPSTMEADTASTDTTM
jgi:hypothetical protein